jgi:hypothetical protein
VKKLSPTAEASLFGDERAIALFAWSAAVRSFCLVSSCVAAVVVPAAALSASSLEPTEPMLEELGVLVEVLLCASIVPPTIPPWRSQVALLLLCRRRYVVSSMIIRRIVESLY